MTSIPETDRQALRNLALKQYEYSQLPIMAERKKLWTDHNDLKASRPMIHVELRTFEQDLIPSLVCRSEAARVIEKTIRRNITNHEDIDDDRVVYDYYPLEWQTWFRPFGLTIERNRPRSGGVGHQFIHPIKDFPKDFDALGESTWGVHRSKTLEWIDLINDLIGDILPVRLTMGSLTVSLSQHIVHLMGMEALMFALMDHPNRFHEFIGRITDDLIGYFLWLESEKLLILNNQGNDLGQGSFGYCSELPRRNGGSGIIRTSDLWAMMESQETVSISPQMYGEFFYPYYLKVAKQVGMISYGCCEPVHPLWDKYISTYPNVRKVSISPWCEEELMGERLKGSRTIFHRKPSPLYMGVGKVFDESGFRDHFGKTLCAARGCKLEVSYRDVYTLCGDRQRARSIVAIMRQMINDKWEG